MTDQKSLQVLKTDASLPWKENTADKFHGIFIYNLPFFRGSFLGLRMFWYPVNIRMQTAITMPRLCGPKMSKSENLQYVLEKCKILMDCMKI